MGNRQVREVIEGLRRQVLLHQEKIRSEQAKQHPEQGRIAHWEREIQAFTTRIQRLESRLIQRQRRGR
jgi:peptidoglycan hydrolase CwlO-like protein